MQRRTFAGGAAAAVGAFALGHWTAPESSATTVFRASDTGSFPIARFNAETGRWPQRPSVDQVVWVDETGAAPKPPVRKGDAYLRATLAVAPAAAGSALRSEAAGSPTRGELLSPSMRVFGTPWEARDGAVLLAEGGARLAAAGQALSLGNVPVVVGSKVTFAVDCPEGNVVATVQFWHRQQHVKNVAVERGPGTVTVSAQVPAGASAANLWLEYGREPATVRTASMVQVKP